MWSEVRAAACSRQGVLPTMALLPWATVIKLQSDYKYLPDSCARATMAHTACKVVRVVVLLL